jgi:hypothetical protein
MSEKSADTLEQVIKFAPKGRPSPYDTPVEEAGQAIVAKIQKAAELANEDYDRAMRVAHKPFNALRAAEDQINQLQAENELFRDRATRAERWLQTIQKEIEEKLITARSGSSTNQTSLP